MGKKPEYKKAAEELGRLLLEEQDAAGALAAAHAAGLAALGRLHTARGAHAEAALDKLLVRVVPEKLLKPANAEVPATMVEPEPEKQTEPVKDMAPEPAAAPEVPPPAPVDKPDEILDATEG